MKSERFVIPLSEPSAISVAHIPTAGKGPLAEKVIGAAIEASVASENPASPPAAYSSLVSDISSLLEQARRTAVRAVNGVLTTAYWEIGRRRVKQPPLSKNATDKTEERP